MIRVVYFIKCKASTLIRVYFFTSLRVFKSNYIRFLAMNLGLQAGECVRSMHTAAVILKFC